jgi:hypothetical protein
MTLQFFIIKSLDPETEPDPAPDPDPNMLDPHRNQCGSSTSVTISVQLCFPQRTVRKKKFKFK